MNRFHLLAIVVAVFLTSSCNNTNTKPNRTDEHKIFNTKDTAVVAPDSVAQQDSIDTTELTTIITKLNAKITSVKKEMLSVYPGFGSINNINARTVQSAKDKLEGGTFADSRNALSFDGNFSEIGVYNWYLDNINRAETYNEKLELAKEWNESVGLIEYLSDYLCHSESIWLSGGTGAIEIELKVYYHVYDAWHRALQSAHTHQTVKSTEAKAFVSTLRSKWSKIKKEYDSQIIDQQELIGWSNNYNSEIQKTISKINAHISKRPLYKVVIDVFSQAQRSIEKMGRYY